MAYRRRRHGAPYPPHYVDEVASRDRFCRVGAATPELSKRRRQRWIVNGEICDTTFYGLLRSDWEQR
jgi:hypothetical protein